MTNSFRRRFRVLVVSFEDGHVSVRVGGEVHHGSTDEVVIELLDVPGRFDDPTHAIRTAGERVRVGGLSWLRPGDSGWLIDGDQLRALNESLGEFRWLVGSATIRPRWEPKEMLRAGGFSARGPVMLAFDESAWLQAREPWEKNWRVIEGYVRSGGQGSVRKVHSRAAPTQVGALKVLHDENQRNRERRFRLLREVEALEYMQGRGTPRIFESNASSYDDLRQTLYCVADFIDGPTLAADVNRKTIDIASARSLCEQLSKTLERLHRVGHKHRDLKPDNVILRGGSIDDPVLVDFGMASPADDDDGSLRTEANQEIGNRFLRLPEYAAGSHRDDPRSDITQLLALFFYMITGITPRVLLDPEGRRPHERDHPQLKVLRQQQSWPRLRALFDAGFATELDKRVPDWESFRTYLSTVDSPLTDSETVREIERLARASADPERVAHAARHAALVSLSERFVTRVRDILYNANVDVESEDRLSPTGQHAEVSIEVRPRGLTWPTVHVRHDLSFDGDAWKATFHAGDGQPVTYMVVQQVADHRLLHRALEDGAARVVRNLLRHLNYCFEREPELRRSSSTPRSPLTQLRVEYPIGIAVAVGGERQSPTLTLTFHNNSGVQQKSFSLVVLVPLELCAAIDGVKPERQEGKYDRFEVAVTTTLADRATVDGPILKMHSVDVSAWGERHVFFRLASGDSVYTKSLKLTELFPEESNPDQPLAMP